MCVVHRRVTDQGSQAARLGVNAQLCVLIGWTEWEGLEGRQKRRLVQLCHRSPRLSPDAGDERVSPRRGRGTIHGSRGNSAKKPIGRLAQLFRERAPLSLSLFPLFLSLSLSRA